MWARLQSRRYSPQLATITAALAVRIPADPNGHNVERSEAAKPDRLLIAKEAAELLHMSRDFLRSSLSRVPSAFTSDVNCDSLLEELRRSSPAEQASSNRAFSVHRIAPLNHNFEVESVEKSAAATGKPIVVKGWEVIRAIGTGPVSSPRPGPARGG